MPTMPTKKAEPPKPQRAPQPQCQREGCRHPLSFHGGGSTPCRALGCDCKRFVSEEVDKAWLKRSIGAEDAAKLLGRGLTFVRENASALGGRRIANRSMGKRKPGEQWRFDPDELRKHLED